VRSHVSDQLRRAFEGGTWIDASVFGTLERIDARRAMLRNPGTHSTWEIVAHVTVWLEIADRRIHGQVAEADVEAETFPPVTDFSPLAWDAATQRLRDAYFALITTVEALEESDFEKPTPGRDYNLRFLIDGVIQHCVYHLGQISHAYKASFDGDRALFRHTLATLAYRAEKVLRDTPASFAAHRIGPSTRTPLEILGHLGDLIEWAEALADGDGKWKPASAGDWNSDMSRFFAALTRLDERSANPAPFVRPASQILQGPIADAFTHVGQIAMLRGHAGVPVRPESFARAEISPGRVGFDQSANRREFDGDASVKR
jgi:DinB superfamily